MFMGISLYCTSHCPLPLLTLLLLLLRLLLPLLQGGD
jgi:hypothetical protein